MLGRAIRFLGLCDTVASLVGGWPVVVSFIATVATLVGGFIGDLGAATIPFAMLALGSGLVVAEAVQDFIRRKLFKWRERPALSRLLVQLSIEGSNLRAAASKQMNLTTEIRPFLRWALDWDSRATAALQKATPAELHMYVSSSEAFSRIDTSIVRPANQWMSELKYAIDLRVPNFNAIVSGILVRSKVTAEELLDEKKSSPFARRSSKHGQD